MKQLQSVRSNGGKLYAIGQRVEREQFAPTLNDLCGTGRLTTQITGTVERILESRDGAYMTIRQDNSRLRLVAIA